MGAKWSHVSVTRVYECLVIREALGTDWQPRFHRPAPGQLWLQWYFTTTVRECGANEEWILWKRFQFPQKIKCYIRLIIMIVVITPCLKVTCHFWNKNAAVESNCRFEVMLVMLVSVTLFSENTGWHFVWKIENKFSGITRQSIPSLSRSIVMGFVSETKLSVESLWFGFGPTALLQQHVTQGAIKVSFTHHVDGPRCNL